MKGIIIYRSKYGATRQYVEWLADELNLPLVSSDEFESQRLAQFDFVLLAGSVYMGKWMLREWVNLNASELRSKKIFFVVVCGTPASDLGERERLAKANIPQALMRGADIIFMRGRVVINRLSWLDRFALRMASGMVKDDAKKREMKEGYDDVSRTNLVEVIRKVRMYLRNADVVKAQEQLV